MVWCGRYQEFPENSKDWIACAPMVDVQMEVVFIISQSFYFGPDNDISEDGKRQFSAPIYQPALSLYPNSRVLSTEALRKPDELDKYYRDVIALAHKHRKPAHPADPHFWLRPLVREGDAEVATFGWTDTFNEVFGFLSKVRAASEGQLYWGVDQGWHIEVIGRGTDVFIREGDPDHAKTFRCVGTSRNLLCQQSAAAEDRSRKIRSILIDAIGVNYWDYPPLGAGSAVQGPAA